MPGNRRTVVVKARQVERLPDIWVRVQPPPDPCPLSPDPRSSLPGSCAPQPAPARPPADPTPPAPAAVSGTRRRLVFLLFQHAEGLAGEVWAVHVRWVEDVAQLVAGEAVEPGDARVELGARRARRSSSHLAGGGAGRIVAAGPGGSQADRPWPSATLRCPPAPPAALRRPRPTVLGEGLMSQAV